MTTQRWLDKKVVRVRSAIDGFDAKYEELPIGVLTLVSVPQVSPAESKVGESQCEVARAYVNRLLLKALEDGVRVKYAYLGELSKARKKELEDLQKHYPELLVLGNPKGKSLPVRIQTLSRLLNKMEVVQGTDLILIDGIETQTREELNGTRGWVESCYFAEPNSLKFFACLCKCPVVVVQLETQSKKVFADSAEGLWLRNAELVLTLRHRGGLCLVAPDGTIRRGIEARLVKGPGGREEEDCWMV